MPEQMPQLYEGNRPYIFACYAHADRDAVLPIVRALVDEGFRVWWDDGIELAEDYPEYIADHVYGCDCFVMFISTSSLGSDWCTQEVRYALDLKKKVLPVFLEDVELTRGLQMRMGRMQALFWYEYDSDEAFYRKLFKARRLESCLTEKGKQSRGVHPWGIEPKTDITSTDASPRIRPSMEGDDRASLPLAAAPSVHKADSNQIPTSTASAVRGRRMLLDAFPILRNLFQGGQSVDVPGINQREAFGDYSLIELKRYAKPSRQETGLLDEG